MEFPDELKFTGPTEEESWVNYKNIYNYPKNFLYTTVYLNKLKLNYSFTVPVPTFESSKSELDAKQLEISNAIMLIIKHITNK